MNKISVCMIVKDEAKFIGQAIKSISPYTNEIIVIDHMSSDGTSRIAKQEGAKVFERNWSNNFSDARNYSISKATNPYILIMDADEEYVGTGQDITEACNFLSSYSGYAARVEIQNQTDDQNVTISWISRLFPNHPDYSYRGRIHEQILYRDENVTAWNSSIQFKHYGYNAEEIEGKGKLSRNLELLLLDHQEDQNNSYTLFQMGRTYTRLNDLQQSKKYLKAALDKIKQPYPYFHSTILSEYANCLLKLREWNELFHIIESALEIYSDYTDLYYMYGSAIIEARNPNWFSLIPDVFHTCIQLGEVKDRKYETVQGVGSFRAHYNLGLYYELTGNNVLASFHYNESLVLGFEQARERLAMVSLMK